MLLEVREYRNTHYFVNELGRKQGEYKEWHVKSETKAVHCMFKDNQLCGEYIEWFPTGKVKLHLICDGSEALHVFEEQPTEEERFEMALLYNLPMLPKWDGSYPEPMHV